MVDLNAASYVIHVEHEGLDMFVKWTDPDAHDGRGFVELTVDPALAQPFATIGNAIDVILERSRVKPAHRDGKPNRPLQQGYRCKVLSLARADALVLSKAR